MKRYKMSDVVDEISIRENEPAKSEYSRFVGLEHYVPGEVVIRQYGTTEKLGSAMKIFQAGDILVARRNVYLRRASRVDFDGLTSGDSIVLRAKTAIMKKLLPFVLNTDDFWDFADRHADGTMSKRLSPKILMQYEFSLPDEEKQDEFAEILCAADETREAYKKLLVKSDELVKSQFTEMFGDPIENTKGWPTEEISKVAPTANADVELDEKVWILNLDMIESGTGVIIEKVMLPPSEIGSSTGTFNEEMVLYSKLRPYLNKVALPDGPGYATNELVPMLPNKTKLRREFLAALLRGDAFVSYAVHISGGAQMPRMPVKALKSFKCILPPLDEQDTFIKISKQIDKTKFEIQQALDNLNATIRALVQQEF